MDNLTEQIKDLQKNLSSIRRIAGWTMEELGDLIGVTRQTISNIEGNKRKLSQTQYMALRVILDQEIGKNENNLLKLSVNVLLDYKEKFDDEEYEVLTKDIENIAKMVEVGVDDEVIKKMTIEAINSSPTLSKKMSNGKIVGISGATLGASLGGVGVASLGSSIGWLSRLINNKSKQKNKNKKR